MHMTQHVQALEPRTLLSTVPVALFTDIRALETDAATFKAGLAQAVPALMADAKTIQNDLHTIPSTPQNRTLIATLRKDVTKSVVMLKADGTLMFRAGGPKIGKAVTDAMKLSAQPTNAGFHARLAADVVSLQAVDTAVSTKLLADAQNASTLVGADLAALAAANPSSTALQSDVTKAQGHMTTALASLQSHFQSIQGDFQKLVTDLSGML